MLSFTRGREKKFCWHGRTPESRLSWCSWSSSCFAAGNVRQAPQLEEAVPWSARFPATRSTACFARELKGHTWRLLSLPAGAGVIEAGMVGFLQANSPMSVEQATVATLLFRTFDTIGPALYGALFHLVFSGRTEEKASSPA